MHSWCIPFFCQKNPPIGVLCWIVWWKSFHLPSVQWLNNQPSGTTDLAFKTLSSCWIFWWVLKVLLGSPYPFTVRKDKKGLTLQVWLLRKACLSHWLFGILKPHGNTSRLPYSALSFTGKGGMAEKGPLICPTICFPVDVSVISPQSVNILQCPHGLLQVGISLLLDKRANRKLPPEESQRNFY